MSDNTQDVLMDAATGAAAAVAGGSLFSTFDIIVLVILLGGTIWWLYNSKKENKKDEILLSKYSIQAAGSIQVTENSFISKLKTSGRSLVVFYGSQTGTGEEFAGRLAKEGIRYKMKGMVADPEECDMEELTKLQSIPNSLAVFCMATYGEGDPTDNSMEFYEWLKTGEPDLTGLNYADLVNIPKEAVLINLNHNLDISSGMIGIDGQQIPMYVLEYLPGNGRKFFYQAREFSNTNYEFCIKPDNLLT